ncbi:hypothetical protein EVAR_35742_1 [Eumeta japonica]|uniref:Uncharacterized protein n=1 Tax=Eumeta variegata TaxID=151549 RepID=A0A4C1VDV7_EUMVA|nr:hypothetical protein EVAR_35742_1 [Eumeta japonica]
MMELKIINAKAASDNITAEYKGRSWRTICKAEVGIKVNRSQNMVLKKEEKHPRMQRFDRSRRGRASRPLPTPAVVPPFSCGLQLPETALAREPGTVLILLIRLPDWRDYLLCIQAVAKYGSVDKSVGFHPAILRHDIASSCRPWSSHGLEHWDLLARRRGAAGGAGSHGKAITAGVCANEESIARAPHAPPPAAAARASCRLHG